MRRKQNISRCLDEGLAAYSKCRVWGLIDNHEAKDITDMYYNAKFSADEDIIIMPPTFNYRRFAQIAPQFTKIEDGSAIEVRTWVNYFYTRYNNMWESFVKNAPQPELPDDVWDTYTSKPFYDAFLGYTLDLSDGATAIWCTYKPVGYTYTNAGVANLVVIPTRELHAFYDAQLENAAHENFYNAWHEGFLSERFVYSYLTGLDVRVLNRFEHNLNRSTMTYISRSDGKIGEFKSKIGCHGNSAALFCAAAIRYMVPKLIYIKPTEPYNNWCEFNWNMWAQYLGADKPEFARICEYKAATQRALGGERNNDIAFVWMSVAYCITCGKYDAEFKQYTCQLPLWHADKIRRITHNRDVRPWVICEDNTLAVIPKTNRVTLIEWLVKYLY